MKEFTLFWLGGETTIISGFDITGALNANYSRGALRALDFFAEGNQINNYEFKNGSWTKIKK